MARDDFFQNTKENAAKRVAYRCSLCGKPTIGPSQENSSATSNTGVASHICAAAPGGPRFDPNMTPEQRRSIDNCIWMCQTHSRIIDTDVVKYPVDYLHKLKREAEEKAAQLNEGINAFDEYWSAHKNDIDKVSSSFEKFVSNGQFDLLRLILESYSDTASSEKKELFFRFHLIYDAYCARDLIDADLDAYVNNTDKSGVDKIIEHFIALELISAIEKLVPFCKDSSLLCLANKLISGDLQKIVTGQMENTLKNSKGETIKEYTLSLSSREHLRIRDESWKPARITSPKKYFSLLGASVNLQNKIAAEGISILNGNYDEDYSNIIQNEPIINQLDYGLQIVFWQTVLEFVRPSKDEFEKIWSKMPESVSNEATIQDIRWAFQIDHDFDKINVEDLVLYSREGSINLLMMYLSHCCRDARIAFLEEHKFLLKRDSAFLYEYIENTDEQNKLKMVQDYSEYYNDDFLFQCIKYDYSSIEEKQEILSWLLDNDDKCLSPHLGLYIAILGENNQWNKLFEIEKIAATNSITFLIANTIARTNNSESLSKALPLYKKLIERGWQEKGLYFNYAVALANLGKSEEAKVFFAEEADHYNDVKALRDLLQLRIETNAVVDDKYLNDAKSILTADFQIVVARSYEALHNPVEERKYCLRTLLLDDKQKCLGPLFFQHLDEKDDKIDAVEKNSVCVLKNDNEVVRVAIYETGILDGISPNQFGECTHHSIDDPVTSDLLYHHCDDSVVFCSKPYVIEDIIPVWRYLSQYSLRMIVLSENAIAIRGNTVEEAVTNLKKVLEESEKNTDNLLKTYNDSKIKPPVSIFAHSLGKKLIDTYEFLAFGNDAAILNDVSEITEKSKDNVFVLGLDTIVFLGLINFYDKLSATQKMICSTQVKNLIISEVDSEIKELNSKSTKGTLGLLNGRLRLSELDSDGKRKRHGYLSKLKAFANHICSSESYDFSDEKGVWGDLFANRVENAESGTIGLLQNTNGAILVSDDPFLTAVSHMNSIPHIGLSAFLTLQFNTPSELLQVSKALHSLNFANYMPFFWYEKISDLIYETNDKVGNQDLISWWASDSDDEPSDRHCNVVINLFRDTANHFGGEINHGHPLTRIAISHFLKLHPTFLEEHIKSFLDNMKVVIVPADNNCPDNKSETDID